jgi:hypothetical protein
VVVVMVAVVVVVVIVVTVVIIAVVIVATVTVVMVIIVMIMVGFWGEEVTAFLLSHVYNMRKCYDGEIDLYKYLYRFTHFQLP